MLIFLLEIVTGNGVQIGVTSLGGGRALTLGQFKLGPHKCSLPRGKATIGLLVDFNWFEQNDF